ncbi:TIGR04282 family arsenosugar biosynthesis glycosyltransferase [Ruegeria sp. Ofav3-42]|uniref:TIGR04282 family arsenosugar biosynthesis glycosyltransferase n=1 Tax=Ruegeria sp. Ofav3-42 TaxID=2917759 RepID=UPI001EF41EA6|nr:TIGR04282 family arsenosugar biosynthesis glycosyltransferase [Ruegeria sp. Ofav3-42]MCG7520599.1 TIGR04282 family arsenosugar biosynthesis glycosyltransferase [Ruegeria sp. Ofav3-42]
MQRTLVIMVKEPRPGRVKTRLGRDIGMVGAAWWFRHQTRSLIRRLRDPRWQIVLAVSPDREGLNSRIWPADLSRAAQGRGDLGDRMGRMLRGMPKGPVCLIGADIPGITRSHIARAFKELGRAQMVFGPAPDGGYWLVGAQRYSPLPKNLFRDVRWSTENALADTLASVPGCRVAFLDQLRDVDTVADLKT